jgi:hypothetical protein
MVLKVNSIFFIPTALFFISNPYLLDFFGLCRGYGMSSAIATMSVSYMISGYLGSQQKHIWISFILSILASYANFTLLVFWCAIALFVLFYYFSKSIKKPRQIIKPTAILGIISLLYLALIANPIIKMHSTDEFQYWTSKGFYWDTVYPLIQYSRSGSYMILGGMSHLIAAFCFAFICIYHAADRFKLNWVREYWFDGNTYVVLDYLEERYTSQKIILKTNWVFYNSFAYYYYTGKTPWLELLPYDKAIEPDTRADYYYIFSDDYKILEKKFKVIIKLADDRWLVKRVQ